MTPPGRAGGSVTVKVAPCPGPADVAVSCPPCAATMPLAMVRPIPGSGFVFGARRPGTRLEALENPREVSACQPLAGVLDDDHGRRRAVSSGALGRPAPHPHPATFRGGTDGIADQVRDDLADPLGVHSHGDIRVAAIDLEVQPRVLGLRPQPSGRPTHDLPQVDVGQDEGQPASSVRGKSADGQPP